MKKIISIFGSSAPMPDSEDYLNAHRVGRLLADAGYVVATGGYNGIMAAVSQGAAEAGGQVIGVTSARIETYKPLNPNQWVGELAHYDTLRDRLLHLVMQNSGMIVLPGGIGTLSEFALAWSLIQVGEMPAVPLVLLGDLWRDTLKTFIQPEYVRDDHATLLSFASTPEEAVTHIKNHS